MYFLVEFYFRIDQMFPMRSTSLEIQGGWYEASTFGVSGCIALVKGDQVL